MCKCYNVVMNFYVYLYLREDDTPYYVGKGMGGRSECKKHNCEVPPEDRIEYVVENTTEEWAFFMEKELIDKYGRINDGTGILENLTDGGEGVSGSKWPEWDSRRGRHLRSTEGAKRAGEKNKKLQQDPEWRAWFMTRCVKPSLGVPVPEEIKEKISKTLGGDREWNFVSPEGETVTFSGSLNRWCIERKLNTGAMSQVHLGNIPHHKGWTKL